MIENVGNALLRRTDRSGHRRPVLAEVRKGFFEGGKAHARPIQVSCGKHKNFVHDLSTSFLYDAAMSPLDKPEGAADYTRRKREALGMSQQELAARASAIGIAQDGGREIKWQSIQQLEALVHKKVPVWFAFVKRALDEAEGEAATEKRSAQWRSRQSAGLAPDLPETVPDDIEMIPEVDIRYGMGPGTAIGDFPEIGSVPFNRNYRRTLTNAPISALFVAKGDGDSMTPTIINDDQVLVDSSQNRVSQSDRIWALSIGDAGMIKRVQVLPGGIYRLSSDNPLVPALDVRKEDLTVVGRVVWISRRV